MQQRIAVLVALVMGLLTDSRRLWRAGSSVRRCQSYTGTVTWPPLHHGVLCVHSRATTTLESAQQGSEESPPGGGNNSSVAGLFPAVLWQRLDGGSSSRLQVACKLVCWRKEDGLNGLCTARCYLCAALPAWGALARYVASVLAFATDPSEDRQGLTHIHWNYQCMICVLHACCGVLVPLC